MYLLDFSAKNLPNLKETIERLYPDVKVTTIQADAADEKAISGVCAQALQEEGRLDVFFANVRQPKRYTFFHSSDAFRLELQNSN